MDRIVRALCFFAIWTAVLVVLAIPADAAASSPQPFGNACTLESYGVRFCPAASLSQRVASFDGAPIDADVTLPATGSGPWPTIVMAQPYGTDKTEYETTQASGAGPWGVGYSNVWFAKQGYAVVTYSMRGTGNSCGTTQSRAGYTACTNVEFELGDQRYDARDVQWMLGLLVDEGIAAPNALGVTGVSLGSIVSLELAVLDNRIRLMNGSYAPWTSPKGVPLHISAVYTNSSIADVMDLAAPNGRFLSFAPQTATNDDNPIGVIKASFPSDAVGGSQPGASNIWDVPPSPGAFDFPGGVATAEASEPNNPAVVAFADELHNYHQAVGMQIGTETAPLFIEDGWDDVVVNGASQAIRLADYLEQNAPNANVALQLADIGHPLSGQKAADFLATFRQATAFLNHYLQDNPPGPVPGSVTAWSTTCPVSAPSAGPKTAEGMDALDPGVVSFSSAAAQTVSSGGDPQIGARLDWTQGVAIPGACQTFSSVNWPGTAVYTHPVTQTFTMLGLPTMRFHVATSGNFGQLDARLWDVAPNGQETYVTRGTYALTNNQQGMITWQMWGGGHTFHPGDTIRVELLASDTPTERASPSPFTVSVSDFLIDLPSTTKSAAGAPGSATGAPLTKTAARGARCPAVFGSVRRDGLGPLKLGETRKQARAAARHSPRRAKRLEDFFCFTPTGIRVGYGSPGLLRSRVRKLRQRYEHRVIWISTSNSFYAIDGIRPGDTLGAAHHALKLSKRFVVGANQWYLARAGRITAVLKVRKRTVGEIGIAVRSLTRTRSAKRAFLRSFG
jgi:hypothetical protein